MKFPMTVKTAAVHYKMSVRNFRRKLDAAGIAPGRIGSQTMHLLGPNDIEKVEAHMCKDGRAKNKRGAWHQRKKASA